MDFFVNDVIIDKYGRHYKIIEKINRGSYFIFNLYPEKVPPKKCKSEADTARGFSYSVYLDILDEGLENIFYKFIKRGAN